MYWSLRLGMTLCAGRRTSCPKSFSLFLFAEQLRSPVSGSLPTTRPRHSPAGGWFVESPAQVSPLMRWKSRKGAGFAHNARPVKGSGCESDLLRCGGVGAREERRHRRAQARAAEPAHLPDGVWRRPDRHRGGQRRRRCLHLCAGWRPVWSPPALDSPSSAPNHLFGAGDGSSSRHRDRQGTRRHDLRTVREMVGALFVVQSDGGKFPDADYGVRRHLPGLPCPFRPRDSC